MIRLFVLVAVPVTGLLLGLWLAGLKIEPWHLVAIFLGLLLGTIITDEFILDKYVDWQIRRKERRSPDWWRNDDAR